MESSEFIRNNQEHQAQPTIIGSGGTCELYRVMIHNKFHVLKKLKEEHNNSPQYIESLRREFEIGFQLEHPNIVRYLEYDSNKEDQSILLEFIDGSTLANVVNQGTISLNTDQKKNIVLQLCNVIEYLHSKQTYHLDLKPENILITFRGKNLKLIDFGHSMTDGNIRKVGGTSAYMQPDQKDDLFDASDDIYAIGKTIEYLFFDELEKEKTFWNPVINKCLGIEKEEKFKSVQELTDYISLPTKALRNKVLLYGSIATVTIAVAVYIILSSIQNKTYSKQPSSYFTQTDLVDTSTTTVAPILKVENEQKTQNEVPLSLDVSDSVYCASLGQSLYTSFVKAYNESDQTIKTGSSLQTQITDSIQAEWFKFSSKYNIESNSYKYAYNNYYPNFTNSQQRIMELLYGSE